MKRIIFTSTLILAGFLAIFSCDNAPSTDDVKAETVVIDSTLRNLDTVPLDSAISNITRYNSQWIMLAKKSGYSNSIPIRSYLINGSDLINVLGVRDSSISITFQSARVYLGLNYQNQFKLYMTPVGINDKDSILQDANHNSFVYDLNAPCPSTCGDPTSPLYVR